jgi:hypothetical protein
MRGDVALRDACIAQAPRPIDLRDDELETIVGGTALWSVGDWTRR